MKPPRLELDHLAPMRYPRWPGYALLAVSLVVAGEMTHRYRDAQQEAEQLATTEGLLNVKRPSAAKVPKQRVDEQVKEVEAVVRQLTLPWAALIETVESAGTRDVAILQLQPEAQQRVLRISGEARSQDAMVDYLKRLAEARGFAQVHLLSHQVQQDDPQHPVQFAAQASFKGMP
jgi:Tfp pilus assembly protein PilN